MLVIKTSNFLWKLEFDYVLFIKYSVDGSTTTAYSSNVMIILLRKDNKTMKRHLLNHMTNPFFNLFVTSKFVKEIWDILEKKYCSDDAVNINMKIFFQSLN